MTIEEKEVLDERFKKLEKKGNNTMTNRKFKAFWGASIFGLIAFGLLAFRMNPDDLVTLAQFYFGYEGIVAAGFFGFNFGEHWSKKSSS